MKPGIYRHFKGGLYVVIGTATDTETKEACVIYQDTRGELWSRPGWMFCATVPDERGEPVLRFTRIE